MDHKLVFLFVVALVHYSRAQPCVGCPVETNDPSAHSYLKSTLSSLTALPTGTENEHVVLVKLNKATTQVVNGIKYTYDFEAKGMKTEKPYQCHLSLLVRPWAGPEQVLEHTCQPLYNRNKRSLLGGEVLVDLSANDLSEMKELVTEELNKQHKSQYLMGIVRVLKATTQVVAGQVTRMKVEVAETNCPAGAKSSEGCVFQKEGHQVCNVEVFEQAWRQLKEVTIKDCQKKPSFCAGCISDASVNDVFAKEALERSLYNVNNKAQSGKVWELRKINRVQNQVVAGMRYIFDFEAIDEAKLAHNCNMAIVSQPWISEEPLVETFSCTPLSQ